VLEGIRQSLIQNQGKRHESLLFDLCIGEVDLHCHPICADVITLAEPGYQFLGKVYQRERLAQLY
jgi:hypothetical protein